MITDEYNSFYQWHKPSTDDDIFQSALTQPRLPVGTRLSFLTSSEDDDIEEEVTMIRGNMTTIFNHKVQLNMTRTVIRKDLPTSTRLYRLIRTKSNDPDRPWENTYIYNIHHRK